MPANHYWDLCLFLATLGALNPSTIGELVWHSCPSARALLHVLITRSTEYPPPCWPLGSGSLEILEREHEVVLRLVVYSLYSKMFICIYFLLVQLR